jgi:hypothetical protein
LTVFPGALTRAWDRYASHDQPDISATSGTAVP